MQALQKLTDPANLKKLDDLNNPQLLTFIAAQAEHLNPSQIFVCDDSPKDLQEIRRMAVDHGEERKLSTEGHTIHFDNPGDQARDKANTRILIEPGNKLSSNINTIGREAGLAEVKGFLKDSMQGRTMIVKFGCLGPNDSVFSIPAVQLTDSAYVAHNEMLLYRPGYREMAKLGDTGDFFKFIHSQGAVDERNTSANLDERRIYVDLRDNTVYSVNNQYGGNSLGFKKLAMRLAIQKGDKEGWLCEHMFLMGVHGPEGRKTYFAGAFPSACGKTSTSMLPGETIVGDDIAYFRKVDGKFTAANVEAGMFGIIGNVNAEGDPEIFKVLTSPGEVIFSNVLATPDGVARWNGDGRALPPAGENFLGEWTPPKQGDKPALLSHKNARYTVPISTMGNRDEMADAPEGVELGGVVYGGRDPDTLPPVFESFDWTHGITTIGATLESKKTFATLDGSGEKKEQISFSPMSNGDFLAITMGKYIQNNLSFADGIESPPPIFGVNYFLQGKDGQFLNGIKDKSVWLKWMELRTRGQVDAIRTPIGFIPEYEDLKRLFAESTVVENTEYTREAYDAQFSIRIPQLAAKLERIEGIYKSEEDVPQVLFDQLSEQKKRLQAAQKQFGDVIPPAQFAQTA